MKLNVYLRKVEDQHGCIQAIMKSRSFYNNKQDNAKIQFHIDTPDKTFYFHIQDLLSLIDTAEQWMDDQDKCQFCYRNNNPCAMCDFVTHLVEIADVCGLYRY